MSFGGGGASHSESESARTQSSSSEQTRGFPEAQAKLLSEFVEPKLREFAIPYAESRIMGRPISRLVTVPGAPAGTPTTTTQRRYLSEAEAADMGGSPNLKWDATTAPYYYTDEPVTTYSTAAGPDTTRTEIAGFEPAPRTFPELGSGGLFAGQRSGADALGRYAMSRLGGPASGTAGADGLRAAAPGLFNLIGKQVKEDVLKPEEQRQLNVQDLLAAIKVGIQGVGGSGSSVGQMFGTSSNSNWGFKASGGKAGSEQGTSGGFGV